MTPFQGNELLRGEVVMLRPITRADLQELAAQHSSVEFLRISGMGIAFPTPPDEIAQHLEKRQRQQQGYAFAILTNVGNTLIGDCNIRDINWHIRSAELGIGIGNPERRGRGYGTDALRVLMRFAFLELNLNRLSLSVASYNSRAIAAYQKVGFVEEGRLRESVYRDLHYYDTVLMAILRREWIARYQANEQTPADNESP